MKSRSIDDGKDSWHGTKCYEVGHDLGTPRLMSRKNLFMLKAERR